MRCRRRRRFTVVHKNPSIGITLSTRRVTGVEAAVVWCVEIVSERVKPSPGGEPDRFDEQLSGLGPYGGAIGPLPDGSWIEVQPR